MLRPFRRRVAVAARSGYADAIGGEVHRQPLNIQAIVMFILFVGATLYITYWASNAPVPVRTTIPQAGASLACKTAGDSR